MMMSGVILLEQNEKLSTVFGELTDGKPIEFKNEIDQRQMQVVRHWAEAFRMLRGVSHLWRLFQRMCTGVILGLPEKTEDAQWRPDHQLFLATREAGYSPRHMFKGLIHELGHAFEDDLGVEYTERNSLYGNPPFADNYAATNPTEDFAETFMLYHMQADMLYHTCCVKWLDMDEKVRKFLQ